MSFLRTNSAISTTLDAKTNSILKLGPTSASKVELARTAITTEVVGPLTVTGLPTFVNCYFSGYSTSTTDITAGLTDIPINVENRKDANYTHAVNSAEITIASAGDYEISFTVATNVTSGTIRSISEASLYRKPAAGVYAEVIGTRVFMYNRVVSLGYGTGSCDTVLTCAANDVIKIRALVTSGPSTVSTIPNGSRIMIKKI